METLGLYLLKSAVWLTGFTLVFLLVLRNERYFRLNRIYLLSGIVASILFPLYTWHYAVILPSTPVEAFAFSDLPQATAIVTPAVPIYYWFYLIGMAGLALRLIWQTGMVIRKLRKAGYVKTGSVKLVRTSEYAASFSFFSFVFVNPSTSDIETKEIVNHEREHIQQRHWFDLLLVELLCMLQWFNPFIWIYARLIRQNHEYLADEMALQHTSNPAIYQATLLNQMLGVPVISLANSFSYSLNKKRFKMMKKKIDSPFRKLKMLLVLPLIAMVFYAFAKPEYVSSQPPASAEKITTLAEALNELKVPVALPVDKFDKVIQVEKDKIVKGKVVTSEGKPLAGTSVIIKGTTTGCVTDKNGEFRLKNVPKEGELVFSYIGLATAVMKPDFGSSMTVKMLPAAVGIDKVVVVGYGNLSQPPQSPQFQTTSHIKFSDINPENTPLIYLDNVIIDRAKLEAINPDSIGSVEVLKGKAYIDRDGDKAKNGIIIFTSKKKEAENKQSRDKALYFADGVEITQDESGKIDPNRIESINVLKGENAVKKYGEKGRDGVVEIKLKSANGANAGASKGLNDVKVVGYGDSPKQQNEKEVFVVVEQMPEFPGGEQACKSFIAKTLRYPTEAIKNGKTGKVLVAFLVNKDGKIEKAKVVMGADPALNNEAVRVVSLMPDWKPGKQRGTAVDVVYTMPIEFTLQ